MIRENINKIQDEIKASLLASVLKQDLKLIAVSKYHTTTAILEAHAAGQRCFGESRVQELLEKKSGLPDDIEWHMIGHLQGNKVKDAIACSDYIHGVDSLKLLKRIDLLASESGTIQNCLLQVNISGEDAKSGFSADELRQAVEQILALKSVNPCGLMTMAPITADETELSEIFSSTRILRDSLEESGMCLPELSMGMSRDYKSAIKQGATMVRIGTALFGPAEKTH
ncbi:MAG: YggS family pyridoxal phosphate-dependent enzyme [Lentisphaeria bacterium]|nr:YggS family pyridoxal phosphate-dependent enzyme [Lentisphaeria bacterium]NQZ66745.1 YggS family pyridoxal phosphate-dependent enzyme [Lentisphaeria bacterium]